ncbi:MAG: O-antigen ligase family protein [Candidatus Komeilibacteria bacterium]|nr:O-antigen ligase family protein [Candidatus Komeilibacteria bacterium]
MVTKLVNNFTIGAFWLIAIVEGLSFWAWQSEILANIAWVLIVLLTAVVSWRRLDWGLLLVLGEIFIGSHGRWLVLTVNDFELPLRMGIFVAVLLVALVIWLKKRQWPWRQEKYPILYLWPLFALLSFVYGIWQHGAGSAFLDFNGYLFWLLWPVFIWVRRSDFLINIWRLLVAAVNWLFFKSVFLFWAFTANVSWLDHELMYRWIRDLRFGEITPVNETIWRVFMQSQIYALALLLICVVVFLYKKNKALIDSHWLYWNIFISTFLITMSFSRSFWVGGAVTLGALFVFALWQGVKYTRLVTVAASLILLVLIDSWALGLIGGGRGTTTIGERASVSEPAASSRLAQLGPLWQEVIARPLLGSGFGETVTYLSEDPRLKNEANPSGVYTTYAFEWGYLDIWLKMGLFGLLAYLAAIWLPIWRRLAPTSHFGDEMKLSLGWAFALGAVLVVNIFTPYLNHPLGIAVILINYLPPPEV